jgi:hypothetical protein
MKRQKMASTKTVFHKNGDKEERPTSREPILSKLRGGN